MQDCREIFWPVGFNASALPLAGFLQYLVSYRKLATVWGFEQIQRYSDDSFYAFTRGDAFVATTNVGSDGGPQTRTISYHPYSNGQVLYNIFDPCFDSVTVQNGIFDVTLNGGEAKVYDPRDLCGNATSLGFAPTPTLTPHAARRGLFW